MTFSLSLSVFLTTLIIIIGIVTGGDVRLSQETLCVTGQGCRLKCSLVAGNLDSGFFYTAGGTTIAVCSISGGCWSAFSRDYTASLEDSHTSFLDILNFTQQDVGTWSCSDGPSGRVSSIQVMQNA